MPTDRKSAFFELILYPVRASASFNERILKLDLASLHAREGRPDANLLVTEAKRAHQRIINDTAAYNALGNGKFRREARSTRQAVLDITKMILLFGDGRTYNTRITGGYICFGH